jgi:hypothetical protein
MLCPCALQWQCSVYYFLAAGNDILKIALVLAKAKLNKAVGQRNLGVAELNNGEMGHTDLGMAELNNGEMTAKQTRPAWSRGGTGMIAEQTRPVWSRGAATGMTAKLTRPSRSQGAASSPPAVAVKPTLLHGATPESGPWRGMLSSLIVQPMCRHSPLQTQEISHQMETKLNKEGEAEPNTNVEQR